MIYHAAAVAPMGWISASGVIQQIHRRLLRARHPELRQLAAAEELRKDAPIPSSKRGRLSVAAASSVRGQIGLVYNDEKQEVDIGRGSGSPRLAPSKWGNPFRLRDGLERTEAIQLYSEYLDKTPDLL
eukprot:7659770-Pyramimonas_sp.AAC.1